MQESTRQRSSIPQQEVDSQLVALDASQVKSIQTAAGWTKTDDAEFVHFAVGKSHSPMDPARWYPALRYRDSQLGKIVQTPLSQIISFSEEVVSPTSR